MRTISERRPINLKVVKFELDFIPALPERVDKPKQAKKIRIPIIINSLKKKATIVPSPPLLENNKVKVIFNFYLLNKACTFFAYILSSQLNIPSKLYTSIPGNGHWPLGTTTMFFCQTCHETQCLTSLTNTC